jgi:hypothetical protein
MPPPLFKSRRSTIVLESMLLVGVVALCVVAALLIYHALTGG